MKNIKDIKYYSPREEKINIVSHKIGFVLSLIALMLLVSTALRLGDIRHIVSFTVFGLSLVLLYAASTLYHSAKDPKIRKRLKIFDHVSIYLLIAGSYTPFTIIVLKDTIGWMIFGFVWGFAITGIILKFFFTGRYKLLSTIMYVLMGWLIVFFIKPLIDSLPHKGLIWLFSAGFFYTIGAVIYSIQKIKFNHAIFHIFVLMGSICTFVTVFFFV